MNKKNRYIATLTCITAILITIGCSSPAKAPDLGGIYNDLAQHEDPYRNPVILIPGLLGSKLVEPHSDTIVWGEFGTGTLNPNKPEGTRLFGLPMQPGKNLHELQDRVKPAGTLDRVVVIMVGTPNAGSIQALKVLVEGFKPAVLLPRYPAAVLGTMPAVYALLPRNRHQPLLDERRPDNRNFRLVSPIPWTDVMFLFSSHRNITNDPAFTDNLLYILLEKPREPKS
ncbi:MAG: hypothetical protein PVH43_05425 [Desulfobacterales bacterium]|jgi:hypothetical protein